MARNITVSFEDGTSHVYQNAPDTLTPEMVQERAQKDFGKSVVSLDGGRGATGGIPIGRQGAAGIPTETGANLIPTATQPRSMFERVMGNIETLPALAGGAVGGLVAPIAQLGHEMLGGQAFTPEGKAAAAKFGQQVSGQFYQPRTPEAQRNVQAVGEFMAPMVGVPMGALGDLGRATAPATRAIGDVARSEGSLVKGAIAAPLEARAARIQEGRVAQSYANAPTIEAAQAAQRIGAAVNPAVSNPTLANRVKGAMAGPTVVEEKLAKDNVSAVTNKVREDLGVPVNKPLDKTAIETALDTASKPYDVVRQMPTLVPDANVIQSIEALRKPASAVAKGKVEASNALINNMLEEVRQGRSGADILTDIRQLRAEANSIYKRRDKGLNVPTAAEIAEADTRTGIAKAYEQLIDSNVTDPKTLGDLQAARTKMAQIYDHERALDYGQQKIDPQAYAKMYDERKGNMTGVGADIGKAASVFPSVFTLTPAAEGALPRLSRAGAAGALGAALGSPFGPMGAAAGLAAGTGTGAIAGGLAAKRIGTPAYQAAHAIPKDYRPPVNMLRPVEPSVTTNSLVPYNYAQSVVMPGEQPNFVFGRPEAQVTAGMPQGGPAQLAAPSAQGTMNALRTEQARAGEMSRTLGQQAEAAQAAQAAAAPRQPATGGIQFDLDPVTGRLVPTSAGVRGATPEVFQADTGASLKSATDKVAAGQQFAMSAAEKVAWDKTRVDLASVAPEYKSLTPKQLSTKMMDRQWVADTISKIQEKIAAFDEIGKRAQGADAIRAAVVARDKLADTLMTLEETLRPPRPVSGTTQGPKTRDFIRNQLNPSAVNPSTNALAP